MNTSSNIPDKLIVLINTDLPDASSIEYKPSMSIPNIASSYICFNPLVKITNTAINEGTTTHRDKIIKFLDKRYFDTLIKDSKQFTKTKSNTLLQATQLGVVDNNIELTLKTIFGNNSVLNINNKTYTIYSFEWEQQNWVIAPTISTPTDIQRRQQQPSIPGYSGMHYYPVYMPPYIQNPLLINKSYEHEYADAKKEINKLMEISPIIIKGEKYKPIQDIPEPSTPVSVPYTQPVVPDKTSVVPYTQSVVPDKTTAVPYTQPLVPDKTSVVPYTKQVVPDNTSVVPYTKPVVPYTQPLSKTSPPRIELPNKLYIENAYDAVLNKGIPPDKTLQKKNKSIDGFLKSNSYYELVNGIYNRMYSKNESYKKYIIQQNQQFVAPSAKKNVMTINGIKLTTDSIKLQETPTNGDCLFAAISEAINLYNSNDNNTNKIIYTTLVNGKNVVYGENNMFTQLVIRRVLLDNIFADAIRYQQIIETVQQYLSILNDAVETAIQQMRNAPTVDEIMDIVNATYSHQYADMTFLIKKTDKITDANINGPFFTIIPDNEVPAYILSSNYWGNELVFSFIQTYLQISIIVIKKNIEQTNYKIVQELLSEQNEELYPSINSWNKYMFVFLSGTKDGSRHYEGIKWKTYNETDETFYSIFDNNEKPSIIPPLCMLAFLYGSYYYTTPDKSKNLLLIPFLNEIDNAFENIVNTPYTDYPRRYSKTNNPKTQVETFYSFFNIQIKQQSLITVRENFAKVSWPTKTRKTEVEKLKTGGGTIAKTLKNREQIDNSFVGGDSKNKLGYYVNITLYLYANDKDNPPGKIPLSSIPKMLCKQNTNAWRASLGEIVGVEQTIKTDYSSLDKTKRFVPQYMHGGKILHIKNKAIQNKLTKKKGISNNRLIEIKNSAIQNKITRKNNK